MKLVRKYNKENGKANEGTDSAHNEFTEGDGAVLSHSNTTATAVRRSRSKPTSTGQKPTSTGSTSNYYNKRGRYDTSRERNNSNRSFQSPSSQRSSSQNFRHDEKD